MELPFDDASNDPPVAARPAASGAGMCTGYFPARGASRIRRDPRKVRSVATIVACEDDPTIRRLIEVALRSTGHDLHLADDGFVGYAVATRLQPDLVVTDLVMPNVDGLELIHRLRQDTQLAHVPVLLLSASQHVGELPPGVVHLAKPFGPADLRSAVSAILAAAAAAATTTGPSPFVDAAFLDELRAMDPPGDSDSVAMLIDLFLQLTPNRLVELRAAVAQGNLAVAHKLAHTIRGSAGIVGAMEVLDRAEAVEDLQVLTGEDPARAVAALDEAYGRAHVALLAERARSARPG